LLAITYVAGLIVLFALSPTPLVNLFRPADAGAHWDHIQPLAIDMVQLISIYLLADAITIVFSGALRGAGDTFWNMIVSVSIHWLLVAVTFVCFHVLSMSPLSTWIAVIVFFCMMAGLYAIRYYKGGWREKALKLLD